MSAAPYRTLILAIHPSSRGFGWIAMENPFTIHSFGTVGARGSDKNSRCLRRIEKLLARLTPEVVVLEAFEPEHARRADRITSLGRAVVALAMNESTSVAVYGSSEVLGAFLHLGARTRHEVAEAIVRLFPRLKRYLPRKRRAWESEQWRLSLFSAAALVLTYYQRDAAELLAQIVNNNEFEDAEFV